MLKAHQYPPVNSTHTQAKSGGRKPLQPRNFQPNPPTHHHLNCPNKAKPEKWVEIAPIDDSNKENNSNMHVQAAAAGSPMKIEMSLAEELRAMRLKVERMRVDKEQTEKMLRERELAMEAGMKELIERGEMQTMLEIEVDRLFRVKELKASCTRKTPIRSLRERQRGRTIEEEQSQDINNSEDATESIDESPMPSPISEIHSET